MNDFNPDFPPKLGVCFMIQLGDQIRRWNQAEHKQGTYAWVVMQPDDN
jgi:hypothetical protein